MSKGILTRRQMWRKTCYSSCLSQDNNYDLNNYDLNNYDIEYLTLRDDKNVSFNSFVKVILIPELKEYKCISLDKSLWYSKDDYFGFMNDKISEDELIEKKKKYNTI